MIPASGHLIAVLISLFSDSLLALSRDLKTPQALSELTAELTKITVEAALNAELHHHIGYAPNDPDGYPNGNSRNGYTTKTLKGNHGEIELTTPRDRNGSFEPQRVKKGQRRLTQWMTKY